MIIQEKQTIICKNGEEIQGKWRTMPECPDIPLNEILDNSMAQIDTADVKLFSVLQEFGLEDKIVLVPASEVLRVEKLFRVEDKNTLDKQPT